MPTIKLTEYPTIPDVCVITGDEARVGLHVVKLTNRRTFSSGITPWTGARSRVRRHRVEGRRPVRRACEYRRAGRSSYYEEWVEAALPFSPAGFHAFESARQAILAGDVLGVVLIVAGICLTSGTKQPIFLALAALGIVPMVLMRHLKGHAMLKLKGMDEKSVAIEIPSSAAARAFGKTARQDEEAAREFYREQFAGVKTARKARAAKSESPARRPIRRR
jgi:hypothetical protein